MMMKNLVKKLTGTTEIPRLKQPSFKRPALGGHVGINYHSDDGIETFVIEVVDTDNWKNALVALDREQMEDLRRAFDYYLDEGGTE